MAPSAGEATGGDDGVVTDPDSGCGGDGSTAWSCGSGEDEESDGIIAGSGRSAAASGLRWSGGWTRNGCDGADACRSEGDGVDVGGTGAVGGTRDRIRGCTWRCGCGHACSGGCDHDTVFTRAGAVPG